MKNKENIMFHKVTTTLSKKHIAFLEFYAKEYNLTPSRLVAIAVDNECAKKEGTFFVDLNLPESGENEEYAYAEEAGRILSYMQTILHVTLDMLYIMRHEIGVPNKIKLLGAVRELLDKKMIEAYKPEAKAYVKEWEIYYRVRGKLKPKAIKLKNEGDDYKQYQKLKKKFEKKGE